jgi:hypothetical protein
VNHIERDQHSDWDVSLLTTVGVRKAHIAPKGKVGIFGKKPLPGS